MFGLGSTIVQGTPTAIRGPIRKRVTPSALATAPAVSPPATTRRRVPAATSPAATPAKIASTRSPAPSIPKFAAGLRERRRVQPSR